MNGDILPDQDHVSRLCAPSQLDEAGHPTASAFRLRADEEYLSVNWLEYLNLPELEDQLAEVTRVLRTKRKVPATARLARLHVGLSRARVSAGTAGSVNLQFRHVPEELPSDPSHSGIDDLPHDHLAAAELLAMSVSSLHSLP